MCSAIFSAFFLIVFFSSEVLSSPKAGVYVDNGFDQTAIDRDLSKKEQRELELEILNLFGLSERPKKVTKSVKRSAPKFLLDVYKALMQEDDEHHRSERSVDSNDLNFSGEEQKAIDESDVIMTFESINHHVSGVRHERGKRLWFNVSELPIAENIVGAELRIYQKNIVKSLKKANMKYTVTVYELINTDSGERELEYISAINTTGSFSGWLVLNLTGCLPTWVAFPDSNKGLYLSVHPVDKPGHEIRPEDIGLSTVNGEDDTQAFIVAFLKATNHVKPKRSTREVTFSKRRARQSETYASIVNPSQYHVSSRSCRIHTLYISFKDLNWEDWIIAPTGYSAFYCDGECNFPLNAHMNATNHAIVQTLVHLMNPLKVPKPCCAPTRLSPISVLYFLDDTNVVLKKYKKMMVKSCGCH